MLLTVDDGHIDFYEIALPILTKLEIPSLVFVTSGLIDSREWLWFDRLEFAIENAVRGKTVTIKRLRLSTHSAADRSAATESAAGLLKLLPEDAKQRLLDHVVDALEVDVPSRPPWEFGGLTWDQLRRCDALQVTVGGHCKTHPVLTRLPDYRAVLAEVAGGKRELENGLRRDIHCFAYPNGLADDLNDATVHAVREAGFDTAFAAMPAMVKPPVDRLRLPRIPADLRCPQQYFERIMTGVGLTRQFRVPATNGVNPAEYVDQHSSTLVSK